MIVLDVERRALYSYTRVIRAINNSAQGHSDYIYCHRSLFYKVGESLDELCIHRLRPSGYIKFLIVFFISTFIVFSFSVREYEEYQCKYGRFIDMMWRVSRHNWKERMREEFDRNYTYIKLLEWVDAMLYYVPLNVNIPEQTRRSA